MYIGLEDYVSSSYLAFRVRHAVAIGRSGQRAAQSSSDQLTEARTEQVYVYQHTSEVSHLQVMFVMSDTVINWTCLVSSVCVIIQPVGYTTERVTQAVVCYQLVLGSDSSCLIGAQMNPTSKLLSPHAHDINLSWVPLISPSDPTRSIVVIWVNFIQTELMVKIHSKSLVRAIGEVLLMKFS